MLCLYASIARTQRKHLSFSFGLPQNITNHHFFRSKAEPEWNSTLWNETETGTKNISFGHPGLQVLLFFPFL